MRINELVNWIGSVIEWSFGILTTLGNGFNWFIIIVMSIMAVLWINQMATYNRQADRNGTLK